MIPRNLKVDERFKSIPIGLHEGFKSVPIGLESLTSERSLLRECFRARTPAGMELESLIRPPLPQKPFGG